MHAHYTLNHSYYLNVVNSHDDTFLVQVQNTMVCHATMDETRAFSQGMISANKQIKRKKKAVWVFISLEGLDAPLTTLTMRRK